MNLRTMYVGQLFPERVRVKLPIAETHLATLATAGGGGGAWYQKGFNLNNLFAWDPETTAHQPRGFNQWAAFYRLCYVVKQKVNLGVMPNSASSRPLFAALYQSYLGTGEIVGSSQLYDNMERLRDPQLNAVWMRYGSAPGENGWQFISQTFYTRANYESHPVDEFIFSTDGTGAPGINREFHVFLRQESTSATTETVWYHLTATVDCIFSNPQNFTGS